MAFFKNLFKPATSPAPAATESPWAPAASAPSAAAATPKASAMQLSPVPAQLPKITAPTAAEICKTSDPKPAAQQLLTPQQTPSQYLNALQEHHHGDEMVKTLAHGMPDREGVGWAAQSAEKVSAHLPPADVQALHAAKAWSANPTAETQAAAAAAVAKTDMQGPGALAAQGAAWAKPTAGAAPRLTPHAVAGSVLLSAAIAANPKLAAPKVQSAVAAVQVPAVPQAVPVAAVPTIPPAVQAQTFKAQHPFIAAGIDIASGKTAI